jgi:hypothetical protein
MEGVSMDGLDGFVGSDDCSYALYTHNGNKFFNKKSTPYCQLKIKMGDTVSLHKKPLSFFPLFGRIVVRSLPSLFSPFFADWSAAQLGEKRAFLLFEWEEDL